MKYFYIPLGIMLVIISACVSPPTEENISEQTTTTYTITTTIETTSTTTILSRNDSKCGPICKAIGTRSEGWYDSCTNELIRWDNCDVNTTFCSNDKDCGCGTHTETGKCFYGNVKYVNTSKQCPDFCGGISGKLEIKCINNECKQISSVTTTTTTTTTSTLPEIKRDITISKEGKYQLLMNFTSNDNRFYSNVHLDNGPFYINEMFVVNGRVYKYLDYKEKPNHKMEIKIRDAISGNTITYTLNAYNGTPFELKTYSFEESSANDKTIKITPDSDIETTSIYNGTAFGIPILFNEGDLYLGIDAMKIVGVTADVIGFNYMENFNLFGIKITAIDENSVNLNRDSTGRVADDDTDDIIIKIKDAENEFVYVDFYDRNYDRTKRYSESVKASTRDVINTQIGTPAVTIDNPEDSLLILPGSGYRIKITYGYDNSIRSIRIFYSEIKLSLQ